MTQEPEIQTVYMADLSCLLCGAPVGTIESDTPNLRPSAQIRLAGSDQLTTVPDWRRLRCRRCGGATMVDELHQVSRMIEPPDEGENKPRRGRPPKWLVEQRRLERERLEAMQS